MTSMASTSPVTAADPRDTWSWNRAMPITTLASGSTMVMVAWDAVMGPAWKAFWASSTPTSPVPSMA